METTTWTLLGSLFLAGLAGSLHCMGMCGPILAGFAQTFARGSQASGKKKYSLLWDFVGYHVGRVWTYSLLGFLMGMGAAQLEETATWLQFQHALAWVAAIVVILSGLGLAGLLPWRSLGKLTRCTAGGFVGVSFLTQLAQGRGLWPRLLLGAVMGFLPCGLVYAMLALAATLANPWLSALGMMLFGLGTVPSLSAVLGLTQLASEVSWLGRLRKHGSHLAAVLLLISGGWMAYRATITPQEGCSHCHSAPAAPEPAAID